MENFDELAIEELTDDELNLVSGGWMTQVKSEDCWIFSPGPRHPLRVVF